MPIQNFFTGYLALGVGTGSSFQESTDTTYTRQPLILAPLFYGATTNAATTTFAALTNAALITQQAIFDSASGGNLLGWWPLGSPSSVAPGAALVLPAGQVALLLADAAPSAAAAELSYAPTTVYAYTNGGAPVTTGTGATISRGVLSAAVSSGGGGGSALAAIAPASVLANTTGNSAIPTATPIASLIGTQVGMLADGGAVAKVQKNASPYQSVLLEKVPLLGSRWLGGSYMSNGTTDKGGTSRIGFQAAYAVHDPQALFVNITGADLAPPNPVTISAAFEVGGVLYPVTVGGSAAYTLAPFGQVQSDPGFSLTIPANTLVYVRTQLALSLPPLAQSVATSATGGTLPAATYYYKVTQVAGLQGESGQTAEINVATTGTTSANTLAWSFDPLAVANTAVRIYRGTASGAETLLVALPANTTGFVDTGALTPGTATVPANQKFPIGCQTSTTMLALTNQGSNYGSIGSGAGTNQLATAGTAWISGQSTVYGPVAVLATPDSGLAKGVAAIFGDSIAIGYNEIVAAVNSDRGWLARGLQQASPPVPYYLLGKDGEYSSGVLGSGGRMRLGFAQAASDAFCLYGANDLANGTALATLQTNSIALWQEAARRGVRRVWQSTCKPITSSTDSFQTTANQLVAAGPVVGASNATPVVITSYTTFLVDGQSVTVAGVGGNTAANGVFYAHVLSASTFALYNDAAFANPVAGNAAYTSGGYFSRTNLEAVRVAWNTWLRAGAPLASATALTPVAVGTPGALLMGQAGHPLTNIIDMCAPLEVNPAGTLTQNGGLWAVSATNATATGTANLYTLDGQHPIAAATALLAALVPAAQVVP